MSEFASMCVYSDYSYSMLASSVFGVFFCVCDVLFGTFSVILSAIWFLVTHIYINKYCFQTLVLNVTSMTCAMILSCTCTFFDLFLWLEFASIPILLSMSVSSLSERRVFSITGMIVLGQLFSFLACVILINTVLGVQVCSTYVQFFCHESTRWLFWLSIWCCLAKAPVPAFD